MNLKLIHLIPEYLKRNPSVYQLFEGLEEVLATEEIQNFFENISPDTTFYRERLAELIFIQYYKERALPYTLKLTTDDKLRLAGSFYRLDGLIGTKTKVLTEIFKLFEYHLGVFVIRLRTDGAGNYGINPILYPIETNDYLVIPIFDPTSTKDEYDWADDFARLKEFIDYYYYPFTKNVISGAYWGVVIPPYQANVTASIFVQWLQYLWIHWKWQNEQRLNEDPLEWENTDIPYAEISVSFTNTDFTYTLEYDQVTQFLYADMGVHTDTVQGFQSDKQSTTRVGIEVTFT